MADNVAITAGSGTTVGSDELTINAVAVQVQRTKQVLGRDGTYTADWAGRDLGSGDGAGYVDVRQKRLQVQVTPTVSTSPAYTAGDCVGGLQTISNAVRVSGGSCQLTKFTLLDKTAAVRPQIDLVLFDRTVTVAGDNAPFACSDADMAFCIGVIALPVSSYNTAWPGTALNSILTMPNTVVAAAVNTNGVFPLDLVLNGTDLFVQPVVRTTPTFVATNDLVFTYTFLQD